MNCEHRYLISELSFDPAITLYCECQECGLRKPIGKDEFIE